MTNKKMSDVFDLPLMHDSDLEYISNLSGDNLAAFNTLDQDRAAVHAINNHDALVELNKELSEALENLLWSIAQSDDCDIPLGIVKEAGNAVKKAKELTND